MIKAPLGIVWTLVGDATPFSTWSFTRPHMWTGHRAFRVVGALGNAYARAGSKTTSGARPESRPPLIATSVFAVGVTIHNAGAGRALPRKPRVAGNTPVDARCSSEHECGFLPRRFATLGRRRRGTRHSAERQLAWSWRARLPCSHAGAVSGCSAFAEKRSRPFAGAGGLVRIHVRRWWEGGRGRGRRLRLLWSGRIGCAPRGGRRGLRRGAAGVGSAA